MSTETPTSGAEHSASSDEFHAALADYLARIERDGSAALEAFKKKHPAFASRLGRQLEWLADSLARRKEGLPECIGPYRVQQLLGTGGMGEVYLAQQTTPFRRPVAVKVIKIGGISESRLARFATEIQALASLNHDGIAKVFEAGNDRDRPYFAMEYVPGKAITDYCAEEQLGLEARLRLFVGICRAVEHAHRQGIIHRDLKPQNILVFGPPTEPVAKIIDFGLAKVLHHEPVTKQQTQTGQFVGTPDYMSPEQVDDSGLHVVDTRADVYALGVVLYELLTGMLPLSLWQLGVQDLPAIIRQIREREPSSPSVRVEETPATPSTPSVYGAMTKKRLSRLLAGDLDSIVMMAMAKNAARRYSGAGQLADDIQRYLRHEPVSSRPATTGYVLRKFVRRHRAGVSFLATLTLVALGSAVTIYLLAVQSMQRLEHGNLFGLARYLDELRQRDFMPRAARPENVAALQEWMAAFDLLLAQRGRLSDFLASPEVDLGGATDPAGWASGRFAQRTLRETVRDTLDVLGKMIQPGAQRDKMQLRIEWAQNVKAQTVDAHKDQWERVRREVLADWGFDLPPQVGLVPLARDPETRLQEFYLPLPGGDPPEFIGGRWVVADTTCPVFVLLPGGDSLLGAQGDTALPRFDPELRPFEDAPQRVVLEPFFASKYEVTNAQWRLVVPGGHDHRGHPTTRVLYEPTHPLVEVQGELLLHVLEAWGIQLPSWQQWEYLARGGTEGPRWCGADERDLQRSANLYDEATGKGEGDRVKWSDGFGATAPVGSFRANPFLLYDVLGNVNEVVTRPSPNTSGLEIRGGSWNQGAAMARATSRVNWAGNALQTVGIRPVVLVKR